jgi:hypothetical protein
VQEADALAAEGAAGVTGWTTARGYGWRHQKIRALVKTYVDAGEAVCVRCGWPIWPGEPWDLGHADDDRSVYTGPEHRACNPHDLRHRRISLLHLRGMPWARIGEQVGQRNLAVTANTYSHVLIDEAEVDYADLLRG